MRIAIVGAGMAGLACADGLSAGGLDVALFDKGRGPGGRMSTRRLLTPLGEASFDHGAQYFTARDPEFAGHVLAWVAAGVVAKWPAAGPDAWVGTPGMNAPVRAMAARHDVRWNARVHTLERAETWRLTGPAVDESGFDAVVLAVPAEQVAPLAAQISPAMAAEAAATRSEPCWTMMAAFAERLIGRDDVIRDRGAIGWAARNSSKPKRVGPESWVVQASPAWSRKHLEDDVADVKAELLNELTRAMGCALPTPIALDAHRWRYARSGCQGAAFLWNAGLRFGACGDWLLGPRVESAWVSGSKLAETMTAFADT